MTADSNTPLSRELALRVGLAARTLPDIAPKQLFTVLLDKLGSPLSEDKLASLTVEQLKSALTEADGVESDQLQSPAAVPQLKEAVRYLWGEISADGELPPTDAYADGDMPGSIRVAIASNDGEQANGHFGSCQRFLVYQVSKAEVRLVALRSTLGADQAEDRNTARTEIIADCQILYVVSIGGPAAAKVIRAGVFPVKLKAEEPARDVVGKLQQVLAGSPPPWLAKIMGKSPEERIRFQMENEEEAV